MLPILAQTTFTALIATIALVVVSLFLILCVIVQKPRGGGLAGAFSGGAGAQEGAAFGAQASNVAVMATIISFVIFLVLAIAINLMLGGSETTAATPQVQATGGVDGILTTNVETTNTPATDNGEMDWLNLPGSDSSSDGGVMSLPSSTPTPTEDTTDEPAAPATTNTEAPATDGDSLTPAENTGDGN